jgi:hypothetical protein
MAGRQKHRRVRVGALVIAGLLAFAIVALVIWRGWPGRAKRHQYARLPNGDAAAGVLDADTESRIVAFCSDCHALPLAESFPQDRWYDEVKLGYQLYAQSGRDDLDPPPMHRTVAYFRSRAPDQPVFSQPEEAETELRTTFTREELTSGPRADVPAAVSHLRWTRLAAKTAPVLLACDMRSGSVGAVDLADRKPRYRLLARLSNPCHAEPCDLDADGAIDLVVADLGSFFPEDHHRGRVIWLRREASGVSFEPVVVASGLGRVADVRPADLDADGDPDLLVGDFGWRRTGEILLLRNAASPGEPPRFLPEQIDPRPGTIHLPLHDFNGDGHLDFVALLSQEYECVEAFINQGDGRFQLHTLWAAPDLTFGFSGLELVDLDQDGDLDVLYTNGDAFDNAYVSPWHGVQWLENLGEMRFAYHRLTDFVGAYRALPGDVDLDGDLDLIVVAWLPQRVMPASLADVPLPSILCLEQTSPGVFACHTLETSFPRHACLELADFDGDGDLDFAAGTHLFHEEEAVPWLTVWWNQAISKGR